MDKNKVAIITRDSNITFGEMLQHIDQYAGHTPGEGAKTLVFSENREGWIYAFFSVWQNKGVAIPVDSSSTVADVAYIINDCKPTAIWTSKANETTARKAIEKTGHEMQVLIIDDYEKDDVSSRQADNCPWSAMLEKSNPATAVLIYTSGTTGSPKGVMLSYDNLRANMFGVAEEVKIFNSERRTLILLPLHHILPLMGTVIIPMVQGGGVAIAPSMSGPDIMDTLCRGQVAIMIGVPRLWQTLYAGIKKKIDGSAVTRTLFNICSRVGNRSLSRFVFQSVRKKMGGHIDFCVSGGAALDTEIGRGLRTLGLDVLEGYGMTETAPIIAFTRPGDIIPGCVGLPLPSVECKIVDGELCAKGPNVMQGYYNRPEETAAVIDKDGFIHTGDLARFDEKGRVIITGRTKEIIVLSNGKNVQPSEIEYKLEKYDSMVKESAVVQDGDMLRAIIVPQEKWAAQMSDAEVEAQLKREVLEPYNLTVTNYKKVMSVFVYRGELPRTKLDKLQRFKLKDILDGKKQEAEADDTVIEEPQSEEYQILKKYIEDEKKLKVRPTDHLETDLAFDSLDRVSMQGFLEQTFGMQINADSLSSFRDVAAIAEHVAKEKTRVEVGDINWKTLLESRTEEVKLPMTSPMFPFWAKCFKVFLKAYNRISIKGAENIPAAGPFIIAPNHQCYLDGAIAMAGVPSKAVAETYFFATENHVKSALRRKLANRNNIIIMEKSNLKTSILKLADVLAQGKNIIIFPEGSRTHDGDVAAFRKTFAILSKELNVPIVPVCIKGAFEAMPRGSVLPKPKKMWLEYLPMVMPSDEVSYEALSETVRGKIIEKLK